MLVGAFLVILDEICVWILFGYHQGMRFWHQTKCTSDTALCIKMHNNHSIPESSKSIIKLRHISWEGAFFLENSWVSAQTRAQRTFLWLNISQTSNFRNWLIWSNTSIQWLLINFSRKLGSDFIATLYVQSSANLQRGKAGKNRTWTSLIPSQLCCVPCFLN